MSTVSQDSQGTLLNRYAQKCVLKKRRERKNVRRYSTERKNECDSANRGILVHLSKKFDRLIVSENESVIHMEIDTD